MSILLRPKKTRRVFKEIGVFAVLATVFGGFYIYNYAQYAELFREAESTRREIAVAKEENALLKQEYFTLTDPTRLRETAEAEGMVLERRPQYLTYFR